MYSHVKSLFSNRLSTSVMDFVGLASMGLRGTPGWSLHCSRRLKMPCSTMAGMTTS